MQSNFFSYISTVHRLYIGEKMALFRNEMTQCLLFQKHSWVELFRADRYKCIHGKLRRHISQRCCWPVNSLQGNNTQGKSTLAAVGSEIKPTISNKSGCLLKQNIKRYSVGNSMMTKWNKNLDILPSNYFPNYVMPELKPFQCNTTCWGDIDRAASHTQCLKVILGHSLEMGFQLLTALPPIDACNTLDFSNINIWLWPPSGLLLVTK